MTWKDGLCFSKDPDSKEPRGLDWTAYLLELGAGVTISSQTWVVAPTGSLTLSSPSIVTGGLQTQVRLTGGTVKARYTLTNHIVASDGTEDDRSFDVLVRDR